MKKGGLAVRNPSETSEMALATFKVMTQHLANLLVEDGVPFDSNKHRRSTLLASVGSQEDCLTREQKMLNDHGSAARKS